MCHVDCNILQKNIWTIYQLLFTIDKIDNGYTKTNLKDLTTIKQIKVTNLDHYSDVYFLSELGFEWVPL